MMGSMLSTYATNTRLEPTRYEPASFLSCAGEPLKHNVMRSKVHMKSLPNVVVVDALQKFDQQSKSWVTIENATHFEFCINSSNNESGLPSIYLLPGASVEVMSGSAVGAMDVLRKNDVVRWVVFREVFPTANWNTATVSMPFLIEDDVLRNGDSSLRLQH